jgi:hypothetical protein
MSQIADPSGQSSRCQPQPLESKASALEGAPTLRPWTRCILSSTAAANTRLEKSS